MSHKNIYEMLNDASIDIGEEREELTDIEKARLKKNFRERNKGGKMKKIRKNVLVAGLVLTLGLSQTNLGARVSAVAQSKVQEISYSLGKALNIRGEVEQYSNVVDKTVESEGVSIKLLDLIIDSDELIITSLADVSGINEDGKIKSIDFHENVYVNGKRARAISGSGSIGRLEGEEDIYLDIKHVKIDGIDLEEDLDIKIVFNEFASYDENYKRENKRGKWEYEFVANGLELSKSTKIVDLDYEFKIDETIFKLNELRYNPITQKIYGEIDRKDKVGYDIELRGRDNLGNDVVFYASSMDKDSVLFKYDSFEDSSLEGVEYMKLTPYGTRLPEKSGRLDNNFVKLGEEFTIKIKD